MQNLVDRLKQIFIYAYCKNSKEFNSILPMLHRNNLAVFRIIAPLGTLFIFLMIIVNQKNTSVFYDLRWIYVTFTIISIIMHALYYYRVKKAEEDEEIGSFFFIYFSNSIILIFASIIGSYTGYNRNAVSIVALIVLVPLSIIDRPIRSISFIWIMVTLFLVIDYDRKNTLIFQTDLINIIIFAILSSVMVTYMTKWHIQVFIKTLELERMSVIDILTGLKNRNSFEDKLIKYKDGLIPFSNIFCIYVDVNGLHELNNTQGHAKGDEMLRYVASTMKSTFGRSDSYRIGGDEYVSFIRDTDVKTIEEKLNKFRKLVQDAGYNVAIGYSMNTFDTLDIDSLIKVSEENMYIDKENFYNNEKCCRKNFR